MRICTPRLDLIALNERQLALWIESIPALEQALNGRYLAEPPEGWFRKIVEGQLAVTRGDPGRYMWHSFFMLLRREDRALIGAADFKAPPDERGEVEIGYGLAPAFQGRGYMTETVRALCRWAAGQGARAVLAETEGDNPASQRVLTRCGFREISRESTIWWRWEPPNAPGEKQ